MIKAVVLLLLYLIKGDGSRNFYCWCFLRSWLCSLNEGSGCCWDNLPYAYAGGQGLQSICCSCMSVPAVFYGRYQVFASVGSFPVVFPLSHAVDCALCSSVRHTNSATSYGKKCFAATVEAY